jgi:hypothetical protein
MKQVKINAVGVKPLQLRVQQFIRVEIVQRKQRQLRRDVDLIAYMVAL